MGGLDVRKVLKGGEAWRLLSCNWLHGGVVHLLILVNMLTPLFIVRIGLLYLISGFGGSILSALFLGSNISVGASGAVFGLLGGMFSEIFINWTIYSNKVVTTLLLIVAVNLGLGCSLELISLLILEVLLLVFYSDGSTKETLLDLNRTSTRCIMPYCGT
ncbi:unnamed protein product [Thlaspi arvense]|uniref:RHOMBOID-like protein n=1 Tax=Thlaspi arvense TaxID=13288 RepID=A0AAU9SKI0_THLAR|nr:unnamed protein product [Thlaspi arvense]